jgi:hypothetical protein
MLRSTAGARLPSICPFPSLQSYVGDPIVVPEGAGSIELEATRLAVEQGLNEVTQRAYGLAGGKDPLAFPTQLGEGLSDLAQ